MGIEWMLGIIIMLLFGLGWVIALDVLAVNHDLILSVGRNPFEKYNTRNLERQRMHT